MFAAHPETLWITNMCEPGATEVWFKEEKTSEIASWVSQKDLETHGKILQSGGFTGPLNWYKQAMAGITHASEARISPDYAQQISLHLHFTLDAPTILSVSLMFKLQE